MPGQTTKLTNRERAAVLLHAAGLEDDWTELYFIAEDKSRKDAESVKFVAASVSRWKNSDKIKNCLSEFRKLLADREADARTEGREEGKRTEAERINKGGGSEPTDSNRRREVAAAIDYYDPENQRKQINLIIQKAGDDPKTQLDAIKAIQQTQRDDKQAARDQKQVRAYLPQRCETCPLYIKARERTIK